MYKTQRARSPNVVWKLMLKYESTPVLAEDSTEGQTGSYKSRGHVWQNNRGRHRGCWSTANEDKRAIRENDVLRNGCGSTVSPVRSYTSVSTIACFLRRSPIVGSLLVAPAETSEIPPRFVLVRVPQPRPSCLDGLSALLIPLPVDSGPPDGRRTAAHGQVRGGKLRRNGFPHLPSRVIANPTVAGSAAGSPRHPERRGRH